MPVAANASEAVGTASHASSLRKRFVHRGDGTLRTKLTGGRAFVVFATIAILLGWAYSRASLRIAEADCVNNLRSVGLAIHNYQDIYQQYPSPNFGGHSWRIRCLPFAFASAMYGEYRFDEPWNSPQNITLDTRPLHSKKLVAEDPTAEDPKEVHGIPYLYPCPYDPQAHSSSYLMIVGDDAFGKPDGWRRPGEITDGLNSTIAVAETARTDIHWLSPVDFEFDSMSFTVNDGPGSISSTHPRGPAVLFCDGKVYRLNPKIPASTLRALVTINGGERIDREELVLEGMLSATR